MKRQRDVSVRDGTGPSRRRVIVEREARKMKRVEGGRNGGRERKQEQKKAEEEEEEGWRCRETRHGTMGKINR